MIDFDQATGVVTLDPEDFEALRDPDRGEAIFEGLAASAQRVLAIALMPVRGVVVERFDAGRLMPMQVVWAEDLSVAIVQAEGDQMTVTETHLQLVPAFLADALPIGRTPHPAGAQPIRTTAGEVDDVIVAITSDGGSAGGSEVGEVFAHFSSGWRCTGGWRDQPADRALTVIAADDGRSWVVDVDPSSGPANRATEIQLVPVDPRAVLATLKLVVVGNAAAERSTEPVAT